MRRTLNSRPCCWRTEPTLLKISSLDEEGYLTLTVAEVGCFGTEQTMTERHLSLSENGPCRHEITLPFAQITDGPRNSHIAQHRLTKHQGRAIKIQRQLLISVAPAEEALSDVRSKYPTLILRNVFPKRRGAKIQEDTIKLWHRHSPS